MEFPGTFKPDNYPGVTFLPSALTRLQEVESTMKRWPEITEEKLLEEGSTVTDELLDVARKSREEMLLSLHEQLEYLSGYGGEAVQVHLCSSGRANNFAVFWFRDGRRFMYGGLQFNGIAETALSVLIGEPRWWSIHT